jgi:hypothetical protein
LAERCAFEHEVRRYRARAQEHGYTLPAALPLDAEPLFDFVNQNKAAKAASRA